MYVYVYVWVYVQSNVSVREESVITFLPYKRHIERTINSLHSVRFFALFREEKEEKNG